MPISLTDLVTEHQAEEGWTLRNLLKKHEQWEIEELTSDSPVEIGEDIFLWEKKEDIPEILPEAQYVIIDTVYFSTTSLEAFKNGVNKLWLAETAEESREIGDRKNIPAGGEGGKDYEVPEGFQFFNSPTNIHDQDISSTEAVMTSFNGAKASIWTANAAQGDSEIILGSTTNAEAVGKKLQKDKPVHIISAGTRGVETAEDHIAAYLITRYFNENPLTDDQIKEIEELLERTKYMMYEKIPEIRFSDIDNYVKNINSVDKAPVLGSENGELYFE